MKKNPGRRERRDEARQALRSVGPHHRRLPHMNYCALFHKKGGGCGYGKDGALTGSQWKMLGLSKVN